MSGDALVTTAHASYPLTGNDVSVTFAFIKLVHMTIQFIEKSVYVRFLAMGYVSQHEFDQKCMVVGYIVGSHFPEGFGDRCDI